MERLGNVTKTRSKPLFRRETSAANEGAQFVTGYLCLRCEFESVGLHLAERVWTFTTPNDPALRLRCSRCGADVPREQWRMKSMGA